MASEEIGGAVLEALQIGDAIQKLLREYERKYAGLRVEGIKVKRAEVIGGLSKIVSIDLQVMLSDTLPQAGAKPGTGERDAERR